MIYKHSLVKQTIKTEDSSPITTSLKYIARDNLLNNTANILRTFSTFVLSLQRGERLASDTRRRDF